VARDFQIDRGAVWRHSRHSGLSRKNSATEIEAAKARHEELVSDLDKQYELAAARLAAAEIGGDEKTIMQAQRNVVRLLSLRQSQMKKLPSQIVDASGAPKPDLSNLRFGWKFNLQDLGGLSLTEEQKEKWADKTEGTNLVFEVHWVTRKVAAENAARRSKPEANAFDQIEEDFLREFNGGSQC
jgi:hypothetical protein